MKTSPELLQDILGVLGQINSKMSAGGPAGAPAAGAGAGGTADAAKGMSGQLGQFSQDKKKNESLRDTADALKTLSTALIPLAKGLLAFGLIPRMFKRSIKDFMEDTLSLAHRRGKTASQSAVEIATAMNILGEALPKLAKGVLRFGIMQKTGLVTATSTGIISLMGALATAGNPATLPFVMAGATAIAAVGVALQGIAAVLSSIAKVILAFAGAVVIMVGAIFLATKLFGVKPLAAMGIIAGSILILAGSFALLGIMGGLIARGGIAIGAMGKGLLWLSGGLLALVGAIALMNLITKGKTEESLMSIMKPVGLLALLFAGLGLFGGLIAKGGIAAQHMGKGMVWIGGGLLVLSGVFWLTQKMGVDMGQMGKDVAKTIGLLGLVFAGLGLFSFLIIPGAAVLLLIGVSIGIFSLIAWGISALIKKMGGKEGVNTMTDNISLLIGGVLQGVIKGVSQGLLGEEGSSKGFFGKIGTVVKNTAILIGSIGLLIGVSMALIMFAFAIKAFTQAGVIKTVTGYKENGEPIFGDSVNVVSAGENIAKSIGSFFTTLTTTFKDPSIIPDKEEIEKLVDILMGNQGFRILGIRWAGKKRPGLIDTLAKFADLITVFAKVNQIPVYDIDKNGNPKVSSYTTPSIIATNIIAALSSFFQAFKDKKSSFEGISAETTMNMAQVLLGQQAMKIFGLKFGKDKIGLLEPIMKFSEVLMQYAKFGTDNKLPVAFDEKGNASEWVKVDDVANNIVTGISTFMDKLGAAFTPEKVKALNDKSGGLNAALGNFDTFIAKFDSLAKSITAIDKFGDSVGKLATNIGLLVTNMAALNTENLDKLATTAGKHAVTTKDVNFNEASAASKGSAAASAAEAPAADWDAIGEKLGTIIAAKLATSGEFQFRFMDPESLKGTLTIKK